MARFLLDKRVFGLQMRRNGAKPNRDARGAVVAENPDLIRDLRAACKGDGLIIEDAFHSHPNLADNYCPECSFSAMPWSRVCPRCGADIPEPTQETAQ